MLSPITLAVRIVILLAVEFISNFRQKEDLQNPHISVSTRRVRLEVDIESLNKNPCLVASSDGQEKDVIFCLTQGYSRHKGHKKPLLKTF
jgi:hypothetical protein